MTGRALPVEECLAGLKVALGRRPDGADAVGNQSGGDNREQQRDEANGSG